MPKLKNSSHEAFCHAYIKTLPKGNIYRAALEAGYSEAYAKGQSYLLLENVGIQGRIDELVRELEARLSKRQDLEPPMTEEEALSVLNGIIRRRNHVGKSWKKVKVNGVLDSEEEREYSYPPTVEDQLKALDMYFKIRRLYDAKEVNDTAEMFKRWQEMIKEQLDGDS